MIRRLVSSMLLVPALLSAQSQQEFASRRAAVVAGMPDGVLVALGAHEPAQDYLSFVQSPSFYYLTGFKEPDAALVVVKQGGQVVSSTMFVQPRLPSREVWTGSRLGVEGISKLTGMRGRSVEDLPKVLDSLASVGVAMSVVGDLGEGSGGNGAAALLAAHTPDRQIFERLRATHAGLKVTPFNDAVERARGKKSAAEQRYIRQAVDITVLAQREAMAAIEPGMNEFEIQALIEYTFRRNGADRPSFSTIVGSGPNSTTLHYNVDDRFIEPGDVIVMDIGASYKGYAADVTRTVPASGKFSPQQRAVYEIVRAAQAAAERQAKLGASSRLMTDSSSAVLASGLAKLGLIESPTATYECEAGSARQCPQYRMYYMHGLGHGIGLEVHDPEQYYVTSRIAPGSAFTIEPGIYVRASVLEEMPDSPRNREVAAKLRSAVNTYRNIGVRIEDDYIATESGVEWISRAPREIEEIEAAMRGGYAGPRKRDPAVVEKYKGE